MISERLFHAVVEELPVSISDERQSRVSSRLLVPQHHSVVGVCVCAGKLNIITRLADDSRGRLMDLNSQRETYRKQIKVNFGLSVKHNKNMTIQRRVPIK